MVSHLVDKLLKSLLEGLLGRQLEDVLESLLGRLKELLESLRNVSHQAQR